MKNGLPYLGGKKMKIIERIIRKKKYIFRYGIKKNIKGKNKPVFKVKETGSYTFKIKLEVDTDNKYEIKNAEIILKK
jgi:hypothetical protein